MITAMLYQVQIHRLSAKRVEITLKPTWLGRLLRRPVRAGTAVRCKSIDTYGAANGIGWFWSATDRWVGAHAERYIEAAPLLSIEDIPVEKLLAE